MAVIGISSFVCRTVFEWSPGGDRRGWCEVDLDLIHKIPFSSANPSKYTGFW